MSAPYASDNAYRAEIAARVLRILDAPGVGHHRFYKLLDAHRDLAGIEAVLLSSQERREFMQSATIERYQEIIEGTWRLGGDFKLWSDADYPSNLSLWKARPAVLFFKGDLSKLERRSLALVGRVDPSPEGVDAASRFARLCVENQISVVSGLAKGIDGASHRAALAAPPGDTFAVVGHGLDFAYPAENRELYKEIPYRGAVISQFPLGLAPQRWTFPARNEVMCTMALGTVIIEGKHGCGSIIQADFSFKHDRPVFLLSRNLRTGDTSWAEDLVEKGAHVVEHFSQVLEVVQKSTGVLWDRESKEETVQEELFSLDMIPKETDRGPKTNSPNTSRKTLVTSSDSIDHHSTPAVFFDIDGVIADSRETMAVAASRLIEKHTGREVDPGQIDIAGAPHKILQKYGVKSAYNIYRTEYDLTFAQASIDHMRFFDDTIDAIEELSKLGVRMGAITAQSRRRALPLIPARAKAIFEFIYTHNETAGKKEVGITNGLLKTGVAKTRTAYVGDTVKDLEAAGVAGVTAVGVTWGFSSQATLAQAAHNMILNRPSELVTRLLPTLM